MVKRIEFGSRENANTVRDKVEEYRHSDDDRRTKTVVLSSNTPESVVRRVQNDAFASRRDETGDAAGMGQLSERERESLKQQHGTFSWQQHGFEAMRVKAAMTREGVDSWQDYYEPGEGVDSALSKVRSAKQGAQQSRASIGIEGMRTDREDTGNTARQARETARAMSERVKSAKEPALLNQDPDAIDFLREEQQFNDDVFDVSFPETDSFGRPVGSGRDFETLQERHEQRSGRAQELDEQKHAEITRDPVKWTQNPNEYDYPGIDTLDPAKKHNSRSEAAREQDENELAPIADSPAEWASDMDQFDLPGIDTPGPSDGGAEGGLSGPTPTPQPEETTKDGGGGNSVPDNPLMSDDRAQQGTLDVADPTQHRESRLDVEESAGGLLEDTRSDAGRGPDMNDAMAGRQEDLGEMMGMGEENKPDMSDFRP